MLITSKDSKRIAGMRLYFPKLRTGHGGISGCNRGCNPKDKDYKNRHKQNPEKIAEKLVLGETPEEAERKILREFKDAREKLEEAEWSRETKIVRGEGMIHPFVLGDRVRITIPHLNLKHGAAKEYPNGYIGVVIQRPDRVSRHETLVDVKLDKPWKRGKGDEISVLSVPGVLLQPIS